MLLLFNNSTNLFFLLILVLLSGLLNCGAIDLLRGFFLFFCLELVGFRGNGLDNDQVLIIIVFLLLLLFFVVFFDGFGLFKLFSFNIFCFTD